MGVADDKLSAADDREAAGSAREARSSREKDLRRTRLAVSRFRVRHSRAPAY
jgi:hypothetical protein